MQRFTVIDLGPLPAPASVPPVRSISVGKRMLACSAVGDVIAMPGQASNVRWRRIPMSRRQTRTRRGYGQVVGLSFYLLDMSQSVLKVSEPARYNTWGLNVDRRDSPYEFIVCRYSDEGHRHTGPCEEIARVPYTDPSDAAVAALVDQGGMPEEIARQLLNQLTAKLASHRSAGHTVQIEASSD